MDNVVEQIENQTDTNPVALSQALPRVLVYECKNPPLAKYRFMACFERKAGGTNGRGMLIGHDLNWIGETRKEAEQQAIDWWSRTFRIAFVPVEETEERIVNLNEGEGAKISGLPFAGGRGSHLRGKIRMVNRQLQQRRIVDPSDEAEMVSQGWQRGLKL